MHRRPTIGGLPSDTEVKRIRNSDHEDTILRMYPFDQQRSLRATMEIYNLAIIYMFDKTPDRFLEAVMGRLSRKLIKRVKHFKTN